MKIISYFNPPTITFSQALWSTHFLRLRILIGLDLATFYKSLIKCGCSRKCQAIFHCEILSKGIGVLKLSTVVYFWTRNPRKYDLYLLKRKWVQYSHPFYSHQDTLHRTLHCRIITNKWNEVLELEL